MEDFSFKKYKVTLPLFGRRMVELECTEMKGVAKFPMIRVHIDVPVPHGEVYIFYKVGKKEVDWYKHPNAAKQANAVKIAKSLVAK